MRKIIIFFFCIGCMQVAKADHITGGEMYYTCSGLSGGEYRYNVTLKLFMRCNSGRQFADPTTISVFDRITGVRIKEISAPLGNQETVSITSNNPCITDPPVVCYVTGYFYFSVSLPPSANGYLISSQVNFRIAGINNFSSYIQVGATYTADIPGSLPALPEAPKNNAAHFTGSDLVTVCQDNSFTYSFAATDADGDVLRYSFCNAYAGGSGGSGNTSGPASAPPYVSVPYATPEFDGDAPLGNRVQIDPVTGLISGIAPGEGKYVVTVCVQEIRSGIVIATQRKDLQINIANCSIAAATLQASYAFCRDTASITMENLSTSPLIKSYEWQLFNAGGAVIFNSNQPRPVLTFPDTGRYLVKLVVNKNDLCSDSNTAPIRFYPGLKPAFSSSGVCVNKPVLFKDASSSRYGTVNKWSWDFAEPLLFDDFSASRDPLYTYPAPGYKNVRLIVSDSKGCTDTVFNEIAIVEKPPIQLGFRDTTICVTDKVQLLANGSGNFSWSPLVNILNAASAAPVVAPGNGITYYVDLDDNGCKNRDSVKVRVVDHINLQAMADTVICSTDSIRMHLLSDGLKYSWTPAAQFINPVVADAVAITNSSTLYEVTASTGSCRATARVKVTAIPYPVAHAGADTSVCFNTSAELKGNIIGSSFIWSPAASLSNAGILTPIARPSLTTAYVLTAYDTKGCPKPGYDTVVVRPLPAIHAFAGNDTSIITTQPLQLNATGGVKYAWSPANYLSAADIANPVALIDQANASLQYNVLVYNEIGCSATAHVNVKVYKTAPSVFVPNAFSPNGDGRNDILRPIAAGIQQIEYFNVYNRWGKLVFSSKNGEAAGWNGRLSGKDQEVDTYVWIIRAIDYKGKLFTEKGVVLLIR